MMRATSAHWTLLQQSPGELLINHQGEPEVGQRIGPYKLPTTRAIDEQRGRSPFALHR